mmetsp:Transcript_2572/g.4599  ORF Transcript_2572/g.4599 Transcript_2572/m.4599 type:complete len:208 (-) Transcript_2572:85-708(-)
MDDGVRLPDAVCTVHVQSAGCYPSGKIEAGRRHARQLPQAAPEPQLERGAQVPGGAKARSVQQLGGAHLGETPPRPAYGPFIRQGVGSLRPRCRSWWRTTRGTGKWSRQQSRTRGQGSEVRGLRGGHGKGILLCSCATGGPAYRVLPVAGRDRDGTCTRLLADGLRGQPMAKPIRTAVTAQLRVGATSTTTVRRRTAPAGSLGDRLD